MFDLAPLTHVPAGSAVVLGIAALLGGMVRGFTGFGFSMTFVPLAMLVTSPAMAIGLVWTIDAPFALPLAAGALRTAQWRELLPLLLGSTALLPIGTVLLTHLDPLATRWIIALLTLAAVIALAAGWRYATRPTVPYAVAVGGSSGLAMGLAGLGGMPLAIFWLAGQNTGVVQTKRNLLAFFAVTTFISGVVFAWNGVLTLEVLRLAVLLMLPYGIGVAIGTYSFRIASEAVFRGVAYAVIAAAAIMALPLLDPWLR